MKKSFGSDKPKKPNTSILFICAQDPKDVDDMIKKKLTYYVQEKIKNDKPFNKIYTLAVSHRL